MKKIISIILIFVFGALNAQAQWEQIKGPDGGIVKNIAIGEKTIIANTSKGLFRSVNRGELWLPTDMENTEFQTIYKVCGNKNTFYASFGFDIYQSKDDALTWKKIYKGNSTIELLCINDSTIFAAETFNNMGILRSTNNGVVWDTLPIETNTKNVQITSMYCDENSIVAVVDSMKIYRSDNNGNTWQMINSKQYSITSIVLLNNTIIVATKYNGIHRYSNSSQQWVPINNGIPFFYTEYLVSYGTNLYACTFKKGIYRSTNNGDNWLPMNNGLESKSTTCLQKGDGDSSIFVATHSGVFKADDNQDIWTPVRKGLIHNDIRSIAIIGSSLYASTIGGLYIGDHQGSNWKFVSKDFITQEITCLKVRGDAIYAGTEGDAFWNTLQGGLYRSIDNGENWEALEVTKESYRFNDITFNSSYLFAIANNSVYRSENDGKNWDKLNLGFDLTQLFSSEDLLFSLGGTIKKSFDNGTNWVSTGLDFYANWSSVVVSENTVLVGNSDGVIKSTNKGETWKKKSKGLMNQKVNLLLYEDSKLYAGTSGGVFVSNDMGENWQYIGLGTHNILNLILNKRVLFANSNDQIWKITVN